MHHAKKNGINSFLSSQIKYSVLIISICTLIMGILFYSVIRKDATSRAIETNNEMLYQYRNTIDSLIINNFSDMSLQLLQDVRSEPELKYYINNPLKGNIVDTLRICEHLSTFKYLNPMTYSVAVYYKQSKLLVSTEGIRYSFDDNITDKTILFYNELLNTIVEKKDASFGFIAGSGKIMFSDVSATGKAYPENVINIIRPIPGNAGNDGAVFITIDADVLHNMIQKYTPNDLNSIMIIDESGKIISHTDSKNIGKKLSDLKFIDKLADINQNSGNIIKAVNGIQTVISYQTSELSDWKYIAVTPMLAINIATQNIFRTIIYVALFTILVSIVISLFAAKYLARPIKQIALKCSQIPYFMGNKEKNEYSLINSTLDSLTKIMAQKELEMDEITPMLTVNFITWLLSDKLPDAEEIYKKMNILRIEFPYKSFCIIVVKIIKKLNDFSQDDNENYGYEYEKARTSVMLEKNLNTEFSRCVIYNKEAAMVILVNYNCSVEILSNICGEVVNMGVNGYIHYAAFGSDVDNITRIAISYREAFIGLGYSYLYPEKHLFIFNEVMNYEKNNSSNKLLLNNLINSLKSGNYDKSIADFDFVINALCQGKCSLQQVNYTLLAIASAVDDFLNNKAEKSLKLTDTFKIFSSIADFSIQVKAFIVEKSTKISNQDTNTISNIINNAKEYINKNLMDSQLSLEAVAKNLGISSNYLSRVFHSECEITFVEYITSLKMLQSRKLLLGTEMRIDEISKYLGYSTSQYFISKFKKKFGCTPNSYRCKYKEGQTS